MAIDEDLSLLAALRGHDDAARRAAEHALFERYRAPIDSLLRRMLGRDTEDCLQEVFLDVFRGLATFEGKAKFSTWIYRVALRRAWKCAAIQGRARRVRDDAAEVDQTAAPAVGEDLGAALDAAVLAQRFADALQRLDLDQRTVLALSAQGNLGPSEIAEVLGVPVGTVHSRLGRARVRMRELLGLVREE